MTYTTVEQSQKLIEWCLDPKTADMCYVEKFLSNYERKFSTFPIFDIEGVKNNSNLNIYPCWSLECLLKILPGNVDGEFPQLIKVITKRDNKEGYLIYFEDNKHHKNFNSGVQKTPIEAALQMIRYSIDYGYLNKVVDKI